MKAMEFINSRRPNLEIRGSFLQQLMQWQFRRRKQGFPVVTELWDPIVVQKGDQISNDEAILRNTFVNAQLIMNESETDNTLVASIKSEKDTAKVNLFANDRERIKWASENKVQEAQDQNSDT